MQAPRCIPDCPAPLCVHGLECRALCLPSQQYSIFFHRISFLCCCSIPPSCSHSSKLNAPCSPVASNRQLFSTRLPNDIRFYPVACSRHCWRFARFDFRHVDAWRGLSRCAATRCQHIALSVQYRHNRVPTFLESSAVAAARTASSPGRVQLDRGRLPRHSFHSSTALLAIESVTMASHAVGSVTPPPPTRIRTPPAPRLGFPDSWEPYSPRKSARISSQRTANRTPSPRASHNRIASPRTAKRANAQSNAVMVSPVPSPRKKPLAAPASSRQPSGTLTAEGTANAAAALGLNDADAAQEALSTSVSRVTGMLPTPSKTPQKPPNDKSAANIQSFARNLFASDAEAMPAPRKRRSKKYSGMTMESFTAVDNENSIEIFTDSQDRVPVKDKSADNPFYGDATAPRARKSKRRLVNVPGEGALSIEEASHREDGMVYVL